MNLLISWVDISQKNQHKLDILRNLRIQWRHYLRESTLPKKVYNNLRDYSPNKNELQSRMTKLNSGIRKLDLNMQSIL